MKTILNVSKHEQLSEDGQVGSKHVAIDVFLIILN
jgi:hypothetical protein